ncbi:MAG: oligosaccharide flippase family protein [Planctomycetes bacterium]|nr:oligosaccharide flippase family protein [Planctomycetota bacterium]
MKLLKNFVSLSVAEGVSKVVTFAAFAYVAHIAGPGGMGYVEFAAAAFLCAGLVVDLGFNPYGAREIARAPERTGQLVSEIVVARLFLAVFACLILAAMALWLDRAPVERRLLLLYGLSLLPMPLLLQWVFQGHELMGIVGISTVIRQTVFAVVVFATVRAPDWIWLVAAGEVAGVCCAALYLFHTYRRRFGFAVILRTRLSRKLFREGLPIGLAQFFWAARIIGGTLILGFVATTHEVGLYGSAQRILVALHTFVWLYFFNLLPSLSRAWRQDRSSFADIVDRSLRLVVWVAVGAAVLGVLLAGRAMTLAYGASFAPGGPILQCFAGVCLISAISGHYRFGLIAAGRQTSEMVTAAIGALFAIVLIPLGYFRAGPSGAAVGLLVAETAVWASAWWYGRRVLAMRGHAWHLLRPFAAGGLVLGLAAWVPLSSDLARAAISAAVFALLAFVSDAAMREAGRGALAALRTARGPRAHERLSETIGSTTDGSR